MHIGAMARRITAVERDFPDGVPVEFIAAVSVRLLGADWMVSVDVRPGTDLSVRKLAEIWAVREVMRLAGDEAATSEWEDRVLPEGAFMMCKYASADYLLDF